jgi:glycosyltransferase involved in cell wall biosynthesis
VRIGIDGRALTGRFTGDRTYWLNLLRSHMCDIDGPRTDDECIVYSRLPIPAEELAGLSNVTVRTEAASNDRLWTLITFPRMLKQDGIDVAHTQYTIPLRSPCPVVTTVHDISFRLYPEWFPKKHRLLLNLTVPASMRRATRVITDSNSSRRDILRVYQLPAEKVVAIHLAAGTEFYPMPESEAEKIVRARLPFDNPYVLSVGVLQPRKNLPLLLEAFARTRRLVDIPHKLVLTGKRGWGNESLARMAAKLQITDHVHFTDYVPDSELPALYRLASAVAYPSLYEGFGLPPLEAMATGAPTLVSNAPAMPEVAGDGALVLPVMDAVAWAQGLSRVLTDDKLRKSLSESGIARAAQFTWERTAAETRDQYRLAVQQPHQLARRGA